MMLAWRSSHSMSAYLLQRACGAVSDKMICSRLAFWLALLLVMAAVTDLWPARRFSNTLMRWPLASRSSSKRSRSPDSRLDAAAASVTPVGASSQTRCLPADALPWLGHLSLLQAVKAAWNLQHVHVSPASSPEPAVACSLHSRSSSSPCNLQHALTHLSCTSSLNSVAAGQFCQS